MEIQVNLDLEQKLQELHKQLSKKHMFEEAVASIRSLLQKHYPSASLSLQQSFYSIVCRVATVLKTRYTAPGFWSAGLALFLDAECLLSGTNEKKHLQDCIAQAREHLGEMLNQGENSESREPSRNRGFLFEGHLTVDPEPPEPVWLVQSNLVRATASLLAAESSHEREDIISWLDDAPVNELQELAFSLEDMLPMTPLGVVERRAPPASKEVVAKLPVSSVTEDTSTKLGANAQCAICQEKFVVNDKMQELPCKHIFHPPCLKPWLDEHNSCPICRHELQTDDHAYESWKEQEKEAEEERKGAANAVRGGEYMYV